MADTHEHEYGYVNGFNVEPAEHEGMVYLTFAQAPAQAARTSPQAIRVAALVMRREVAADLADRLSKLLGGS